MKSKKLMSIILSVSILSTGLITLSNNVKAKNINNSNVIVSAKDSSTKKGIVNVKSALNVRSAASTNSKIVTVLRPNTVVDILGTSGSFYKVKVGNIQGFVSSQFIKAYSNNNVSKSVNTENKNVQPTVSSTQKGIVNVKSALNVRATASTSSKVVTVLRPNTVVDILGTSGSFYKVKVGNIQGFVSTQFIKAYSNNNVSKSVNTENKNVQPTVSSTQKGIVNVKSALNVRSAASTSSKIVTVLRPNTTVEILGTSGNFYKVKIGTVQGFVSTQFIKIVK